MDRGSVNEPVVFGGVRVVPGDLILGDDDGLVAIPAGELAAQLPAALAMVRAEAAWEARLAGGETTLEVFNVPPAAIRLAGSQHRRAQPLVDLGHDAAPVGEAGRRLMQQHPQTLDRDIAATTRRGQQTGLQWRIDQVGDDGRSGQRVQRISSGGWPVMPRLVQLTSRAVSRSASPASAQATTSTGPMAASSPARAAARASVRLASRSAGTPASSRATATARAAPPAPSTRTAPCSGRQSGACWRRLARKPRPSLFSPRVRPSGWTSTVFTAPILAAIGSSSSTRRQAASLCGTVTFQPRKPRRGNARKASSTSSGRTGSGT